jgi:hypothetical protein
MGRFSTNFSANLRSGFRKEALIGDALSLVTPLIYWGLPTLLGWNGYKGLAVGFGVPYLAGKLLNVPEWCHASVAIAASHVIQQNQDVVVKVLNKPLWRLDDVGDSAPVPQAGLANALQPGAYIDSFNGRPVVAYEGGAIPEGMSGFNRLTPSEMANPTSALPEPNNGSMFTSNASQATRSMFALN